MENAVTREAQVIALLREGRTAAYAAEIVGVHRTTAQRWARKHGVALEYPFNRHEARDDLVDVREIARLHHRGVYTLQQIADMCSCSRSYVVQVLAKAKKDSSA